MTDEIYNVNIQ